MLRINMISYNFFFIDTNICFLVACIKGKLLKILPEIEALMRCNSQSLSGKKISIPVKTLKQFSGTLILMGLRLAQGSWFPTHSVDCKLSISQVSDNL
jgi:hypothetical protein